MESWCRFTAGLLKARLTRTANLMRSEFGRREEREKEREGEKEREKAQAGDTESEADADQLLPVTQ